MKQAAFFTLGCKVNQFETESISELFLKNGYEIVDFEDYADVYVINTCTVTGLSDRKSRQMIRRAIKNNADAIVAVMGCYAQTSPEEVRAIQGVSLIIGTKDKKKIVELVEEIQKDRSNCENDKTVSCMFDTVSDINKLHEFEELKISTYHNRTRAFLKVQEGCNQFCSYCIIPYARGPVRSRLYNNIIDEVTEISKNGFNEIVLTGIHLASYGKDLKDKSLITLIKGVHEIEQIQRIRLGSVEPTTITEEFVEEAVKLPKLCPQYHISLQSGCDETLKRMNRKYTTEFYKKSVETLRQRIPDVSVTTDVMVGFPGETDIEFEKTFDFLNEIKLTKLHVFKYSRRKGTPAAGYENQVAPEIKEERSKRLLELSNKCGLEYNKKLVGKTLPVLFEQHYPGNADLIEGLTTNHIKVICPSSSSQFRGKIMNACIKEAEVESVRGYITD